MKAIILLLAFSLTGIISGISQEDQKYGSNKDLCLRNYSLYRGYLKNKDYKDTKTFWLKMIEICPEYSTGIWSDGEKIFKAEINSETDPLKRVELIDSLIWTYDKRIEYFGGHPRFTKGYILGKKGLALLAYEVQPTSRGYDALKKSVELEAKNSKAPIILTLMKATKSLYKSGLIEAADVIDNYSNCMSIAEYNLSKNPDDSDFQKAKIGIEQYLISSKAADCSVLVNIFTNQYQENKDDVHWLSKTNDLLKATGCKETELYTMTTVALYELKPSMQSAHKIANMYFTNSDYDKAIEYLEKGVEIEGDSEEKASMYYELAYMNYTQFNDYQKARKYARQASEIRPNWGDPYILIGKMYIDDRESVSKLAFEQEAVFWAAVDKFITAKKVDPEERERANELIQQYSQHFPINEDVFMWTLEDGKNYKVGGWINENTTVRSRKN